MQKSQPQQYSEAQINKTGPFRVWAHDIEDLATKWSAGNTLAEAVQALEEVSQHRATNKARDPHIRNAYRQRLKVLPGLPLRVEVVVG